MTTDLTRQLIVVHLSDIHFGRYHRFNPPATGHGDVPVEAGYPTLLEKLVDDLKGPDPECPVLFALTGDFAETGDYQEFRNAARFVRGLGDAECLGRPHGLSSIFVAPGNHDVLFTSPDIGQRWQQWATFHNGLYDRSISHGEPSGFDEVHDRVDDLNAIVVTLNSSIYVEHGSLEQNRGRLDHSQLERIEEKLEQIPEGRRKSAIRVALIHHHPVLIPDLVEEGAGYDAIHNSGDLLTVLRRYGFHVVLHGHKHNPHVFTEDSVSAYRSGDQRPVVVIAGGSAGSTQLPTSPQCGNTYNIVQIKWHPGADQARIRVVTRGLRMRHKDGGVLLPGRWHWDTLRVYDRPYLGGARAPTPRDLDCRDFDETGDSVREDHRKGEYGRLRGYFPVVEVMPSLRAEQAYEARFWIVRHKQPTAVLRRVTWSAGPNFPVITVTADKDPEFCGVYHYWGSMLIQAHMEFADGYAADAHVYARLPTALTQAA